ncbi:MAG: DUF1553 domain-containing protein [Planctomycetes bacterium]|nr:DUF1553 domain-containing protein [Planctomycetota bacterium]
MSRTIYASLLLLLIAAPARSAEERPRAVLFNRDIRPILSDVCYHCHGPDKARRKAELRLDIEQDAKRIFKGHAAIVPGKSGQSELYRRISATDPAERMPPASSDRQLKPEQIALLKQWIDNGAQWEGHWSLITPTLPKDPPVKNQAWVRNPIDRFILARLEREGLSPSAEAAKTTLIRRLSLDLTGLPPTIAEVDAFLKDSKADAYERLVDRLLSSPRYGERMAWRWLEAARFADTNGYQTDADRDMYRWRDWVIAAFNRNMPFDQFTIEQLAGDMLPNATLDQKIATGFNRNHRGNSEGGIVPEEYAVEYVVDRVETTATVWLGLTLGCTRCHDHKYDPFSQKEFYQLFAYFNNVPEKGKAVKFGNSPPFIKAPTPEQLVKRADLHRRLMTAEQKFTRNQTERDQALLSWLKSVDPKKVPDWAPDQGLVFHHRLDDASKLNAPEQKHAHVAGIIGKAVDLDRTRFIDAGNQGDFGFDDSFSFSMWINPRSLNGVIVSRTAEEEHSDGYNVRLVNGKIQVHLTKRWLDDALRVETLDAVALNQWQHIAVSYDGSRGASSVKVYVNGTELKTLALFDFLAQTFKNNEPFRIGSGGGKESRFDGLIDDVRIYSRVLEHDEVRMLSVPETLVEILAKPESERTPNQNLKLKTYHLLKEAPARIRGRLTELQKVREESKIFEASLPTVMVMEEMKTPREAYLLIRGEYDKRGERVYPGTPAALPPFPADAAKNRLGLAKWLIDKSNPLTARVTVNRMWQLHFGTGLVKTVEDFGTQGEFPSHPELLDYLAVEFVRSGWDMKHMHKLIVMSGTYRQSSRATKESLARDPDNRLLARGPRYRLSPEMLRDQALFTSGLLVEKIGGPSVKPYQPPGLWKELSGAADYVPDQGENLYRRSLYTFWKRTVASPTLMLFDASPRETCSVRESRTNTPIQALALLNDVIFVETARQLAQRVIASTGGIENGRIETAFRACTGRAPSKAELQILQEGYAQHLAEFRADPAAAKRLLKVGSSKLDEGIDSVELGALTIICSLILNLDETICKE